MLILVLTILSVLCGFFAIIMHILSIYYYKNKKRKNLYNKLSIFFRILTLIFLAISMVLVKINLITDPYSSKTVTLKIINIILFLIPIAIIEFLLSFV
jgi:hypothetical protein